MSTQAIDALHDIHTATNDVLKGYREMSARAEPEILSVMHRLTGMHEQHAAEQEAELLRLRESVADDASFQGTLNKVVVILRDWLADIDRDALPKVRDGEEALRDEYQKALRDPAVAANPQVTHMLQSQMQAIDSAIARLPQA